MWVVGVDDGRCAGILKCCCWALVVMHQVGASGDFACQPECDVAGQRVDHVQLSAGLENTSPTVFRFGATLAITYISGKGKHEA